MRWIDAVAELGLVGIFWVLVILWLAAMPFSVILFVGCMCAIVWLMVLWPLL